MPDAKRYWANRERWLAESAAWSKANLDRKNASWHRWYDKDPGKAKMASRKAHAKHRYGLTLEEYDYRLSKPCAICGEPSVALDHDHATNTPRDGLCQGCNHGIGNFKENVEIMRKAIDYILDWDRKIHF